MRICVTFNSCTNLIEEVHLKKVFLSESKRLMSKIPKDFYLRDDVLTISRELLGKVLCTQINNSITRGIIVETEAYNGVTDRASHAFGGRRTNRTEIMYQMGGLSYVYLCYGIHHLFNIVTNLKDIPHAVLIRAIEPIDGIDIMMKRRSFNEMKNSLSSGPGVASKALGIEVKHTGIDLTNNQIWVEDHGITVKESEIVKSPRVGVDYAGEDAKLPWRLELRAINGRVLLND